MRALKPFALGAIASGVLGYAAAAAFAVAAQEGGHAFRIAIGPVVIVAVERDGGATATTFGPGLLLLALAGGLVNAGVALLIARRSRRAVRID